MSWFSRWFGTGGLTNPDEGPHIAGPTSTRTESGLNLSDERAMQLSAVWSCVRLISETVGSLPLGVYERTADGRRAVSDHFLYELLRVSPNDLMSPLEFREAMTVQLALWGNGYAYIERNARGVPLSLTPLHPAQMTPVKEAGTVTYHYQTNKGEHIYAKESILHLKGFSVDGIVGLSPLAYARHTMGISASADQFASKSFSSGGRPSGVLMVDRILTDTQREQLRDIYENITVSDTGLWVLEGGTSYQAIDIPPDDMQMLESRQFQLSDIARFFRVPSHMINDGSQATAWGSGIEQLNIGFLTYTLRPYLTRWESAVADSLLDRTARRRYFVEHNVEGLLRADSAARASFYATAAQNGWMSRNEIRRKENLPPVDGADELTVQVNLTPVDELPGLTNGTEIPSN
jgi:HK97 family phage portal protein